MDWEPEDKSEFAEQLRRFNELRRKLLGGRFITADERLPLPYTGVGGDLPPRRTE